MIVLIDNYDSFTYNLVQYYKQLCEDVRVFPNDQVSIADVTALSPDLIVLSPGPGNPSQSGECRDIVRYFAGIIPILGVCLGHQIIVDVFGGKVVKGEKPMHGKVTEIHHDRSGVFHNLLSPSNVTRYHSLVAYEASLPSSLIISARSIDGAIMGVRHCELPIEGIQFHPESILTEHGLLMIKNSYEQACSWIENNKAKGCFDGSALTV